MKKTFYNSELNKTDSYEEVWIKEKVTVKDEQLIVKDHYWKDSTGELWGDFDHPMENVYRSFDAYRKAKNYLTPDQIRKVREKLGFSVRKFSEALGISPSALTQIENNHRIQTKYQDVLFRNVMHDPQFFKQDIAKRIYF